MIRSQLVARLSIKTGLNSSVTDQLLTAILDQMAAALKEGKGIEIRAFGSFRIRHYPAYIGRNPKTGEAAPVAPKKVPFFKPGKALREKVSEGMGRFNIRKG